MSATTPPAHQREATDFPARFQWLVQSPLRSGLVRFLHSRADEAFDVVAFMQRFGRLQQDVENCLRELVAFGVARRAPGNVIRGDDVQFLHPAELVVERPREQLSTLREAERVHIQHVLEEVAWNKKRAAKILEISRGTLYRKIVEFNMEPRHPGPTTAQPSDR